jgi:hypothetical protein
MIQDRALVACFGQGTDPRGYIRFYEIRMMLMLMLIAMFEEKGKEGKNA